MHAEAAGGRRACMWRVCGAEVAALVPRRRQTYTEVALKMTSWQEQIRWEFDWKAAQRYLENEPEDTGQPRRDPYVRRRTPSPSAIKAWKERHPDQSEQDAERELAATGAAMGFWKPYTGMTMDGQTEVPGWIVEYDPQNNQGFRRRRNTRLAAWKQQDKRAFEVQMTESYKGRKNEKYVERLTHPLPDDPVWMKEPMQMSNGVPVPGAKPVQVDVMMKLRDVSVSSPSGAVKLVFRGLQHSLLSHCDPVAARISPRLA